MNYKYIVYLTINQCNGKFYIGVHKTIDPEIFDGYIGNGVARYSHAKYLQKKFSKERKNIPFINAVVKYGYENFKRTTLRIFDTEQEALKLEAELVTETILKSKQCYNVAKGGGIINNTHSQKVYKFALNGNFLQSYKSIKDAADQNNCDQANIIAVIKGRQRQCAGFYWNTEKKFGYKEYSNKKAVSQYTLSGKFIAKYDSVKEAESTWKTTSICRAIKNKSTCVGHQWRYFDGTHNDIEKYVRKKKDGDIV